MQVELFHENGHAYTIPATQAVVRNADGVPVAVSYLEGDFIIHCDVTHPDWDKTVRRLGLRGANGNDRRASTTT